MIWQGLGWWWWVQQGTVSFKVPMAMERGHGCSDKCKSPGSSPASGFLLGWFLCCECLSTLVSSATFDHSVHPVKRHLLHGAWFLIATATELNLDATARTSLCLDSRNPTSVPPRLTHSVTHPAGLSLRATSSERLSPAPLAHSDSKSSFSQPLVSFLPSFLTLSGSSTEAGFQSWHLKHLSKACGWMPSPGRLQGQ